MEKVAGSYLVRTDGRVLHENSEGGQTPVLEASTGVALEDVVDVADGSGFGCAALGDKSVSCWRTKAGGTHGELGDGTTDASAKTYRATPVLVSAGEPLTDVVALASLTLAETACAITESGELYCWGDLAWVVNDGAPMSSGYAQAITLDGSAHLTGVQAANVSIGGACAVLDAGSASELWCWGSNAYGELGQGDSTKRQYPTKVLGLQSPSQVANSAANSNGIRAVCAVDGAKVRCWGSNSYGETGQGKLGGPSQSPELVTVMAGGSLSGAVTIASGLQAFCALRDDGALWCWGNSYYGYELYASNYGVTNVANIGIAIDSFSGTPRFVTSDGVYHHGNKTWDPNCGEL